MKKHTDRNTKFWWESYTSHPETLKWLD